MNANLLAKRYGALTPEERFRLILAAEGRGDEAEQDRLRRTARRIEFSTEEHAPWAHAFNELANLTFIGLAEDAAQFFNFLNAFHEAFANLRDLPGDEKKGGAEDAHSEAESASGGRDSNAGADQPEEETADLPIGMRRLIQFHTSGYVLRTKTEGWKLFCQRLNVRAFALWEKFPGFQRLQDVTALAEQAAFKSDLPDLAVDTSMTAERLAAAYEKAFRERTWWWGGLPASGGVDSAQHPPVAALNP